MDIDSHMQFAVVPGFMWRVMRILGTGARNKEMRFAEVKDTDTNRCST